MFEKEHHPQRLSKITLWIGAGIGLALILTAVLLDNVTPASAKGSDLTLAEAKYPKMVNSRIDSCTLCHTSAPSLNAYGSAYKSHGRNTAALTAIEALDSDGDGFTNLQEINALTFPGSASDKPAAGPTATRTPTLVPSATRTLTRTPTALPSATRTPTRTATAVASATRTPTQPATVAPSATRTPTRTVTPLRSSTPGVGAGPFQYFLPITGSG
jgi:hypothetical protein